MILLLPCISLNGYNNLVKTEIVIIYKYDYHLLDRNKAIIEKLFVCHCAT